MSVKFWHNSPKRRLHRLMAEISEEWWNAGWLLNLEYNLWSIIQNDGKYTDAFHYLNEKYGLLLLTLSQEAGGWWIWDDTTYKKWDYDFKEYLDQSIGERFLRMDKWLDKYNSFNFER